MCSGLSLVNGSVFSFILLFASRLVALFFFCFYCFFSIRPFSLGKQFQMSYSLQTNTPQDRTALMPLPHQPTLPSYLQRPQLKSSTYCTYYFFLIYRVFQILFSSSLEKAADLTKLLIPTLIPYYNAHT